MPKLRDLTGKRFGRLIVLHRVENKHTAGGNPKVQWLCRCQCGNKKVFSRGDLERVLSCGCWREEAPFVRKHVNLEGRKFERLVVIRLISRNPITYNCRCDCGNTVPVTAKGLRSERTRSCGCLQREWAATTGEDLLGRSFGRLLVVEKTNERTEENRVVWKCECVCGNTWFGAGHNLLSGNTRSCGCWHSEVASMNAKNRMKISDAVAKFWEFIENPVETIKRLKEESNYVEGHI